MIGNQAASERLQPLLAALLDGQLSDEQIVEIRRLLAVDPSARRQYVRQVTTHGMLQWAIGGTQDSGFRAQDSEFGVQSTENANAQPQIPDRQISYPESPIPTITLDLSASLPSSLSSLPSFVGVPAFSYMVATVILGVMLLSAWAYKITHYQQIVEKRSPSINQPETQFVGQVTGMVDCRWSDPQTETYPGASVPLGRRYALASGLMEITYKSGAKVILEGPCTYEIESRAGGYLALGRLTARIEKKGRGGEGEKGRLAGSTISSPPLPFSPSPPLFSVRTPTAIITDLGTEFGIEVDRFGATLSHVFQGKVEVRLVHGKEDDHTLRLGAGESARVEPGERRSITVVRQTAAEVSFARQMPKRERIKVFNTGAGVKEGEADPHWQLVAYSQEPDLKPRPAVVTSVTEQYLPNNTAQSQWISTVGDLSSVHGGVYTFRTTFELTDTVPGSAILRVRFAADNHVDAIRLNGRSIPVPEHGGDPPFDRFQQFLVRKGFVEGTNVLEIDLRNFHSRSGTPMALLVELEGSVLRGGHIPATTANETTPTDGRKENKR